MSTVLMLFALSSAGRVQRDPNELFARCVNSAMDHVGLDPNQSDWNCGDAAITPICLEKATYAVASTISCAQVHTGIGALRLFSLPSLSHANSAERALECIDGDSHRCLTQTGGCGDNAQNCLSYLKCIASVMNRCLDAPIWPLSSMKTRADIQAFDVTPYNACVASNTEKFCRTDSDATVRLACRVLTTYDCGVTSGLLPFFGNESIPILQHSPNAECISKGRQQCLHSAGTCNSMASLPESSPAMCTDELRCMLTVINECAGFTYFPAALIPDSTALEADCTLPFRTICNETHSFHAICAGTAALSCSSQTAPEHSLRANFSRCLSSVQKCGLDVDASEFPCDLGEVECMQMIGCALTGVSQCVDDILGMGLPQNISFVTTTESAEKEKEPTIPDVGPRISRAKSKARAAADADTFAKYLSKIPPIVWVIIPAAGFVSIFLFFVALKGVFDHAGDLNLPIEDEDFPEDIKNEATPEMEMDEVINEEYGEDDDDGAQVENFS